MPKPIHKRSSSIAITFVFVLMALMLGFGCAHQPVAPRQTSLTITSPASRLVFQRNLTNTAIIPISGVCSEKGAALEVRLLPVGGAKTESKWEPLGNVQPDGRFKLQLTAKAGWYRLELQARAKSKVLASAEVERVGIGEVFIVVGHSVAQGGDINIEGATDDRVSTVALRLDQPEMLRNYERTADTQYLPPLIGSQFYTAIQPAPFGHGPYFWAQFAERVTRSQDVPVMIFNAAFGGTSLEHWAKSARGEMFEHSFVKAQLRMPYINLYHTLREYVSVTGVRAILADQGQNDWPEKDSTKVVANYKVWVDQARQDLNYPSLAVVVNRQNPFRTNPQIRQAQETMIREHPACFPGPDYDQFEPADTYDRIHLSAAGEVKAARLWAEALDAHFFTNAVPWQPAK